MSPLAVFIVTRTIELLLAVNRNFNKWYEHDPHSDRDNRPRQPDPVARPRTSPSRDRLALADDLEDFLTKGDNRKILAFTDRHVRLNVPFDHIDLAGGETLDPFFNINAPEDVERAEAVVQALGAAA